MKTAVVHTRPIQILLLALICSVLACAASRQTHPSPKPEEVVRAFYKFHFSHNMAFTESTIKAKEKWLTKDLYSKLLAKVRQPVPKNEVPDIDGDPFTDSQEYPKSFKVTESSMTGEKATVTVELSWPKNKKNIRVILLRQASEWLIDDILYAPQSTLRKLL